MIDRLDSGDSEHNRVGQWVVIYEHVISLSIMKKGWLCKAVLVQHEKGLAPRFSSNMKTGWLCKIVLG